jgi:hypothetical protein
MLNVDYDSLYPFGAVKDVVVIGAERTSVYPTVEATARRFRLKIKPDPHPEQGHLLPLGPLRFRAPGVPAVFGQHGHGILGQGRDVRR